MRSNVPRHPVSVFGVAALFLLHCGRGETATKKPAIEAQTDALALRAPPATRSSDVWLRAAKDGQAALEKLTENVQNREAYLSLRRAALTSMFAWRNAIPFAGEAAFGPEVAYDETAGQLGRLDDNLEPGRSNRVAAEAVTQLRGAFGLARLEIERRGISDAQAAQALSDSAFALGQALSESGSFVPDDEDTALADVLGLLDAVELGGAALGFDVREAVAPLLRVRAVHSPVGLAAVENRLLLVRATGGLGAAIRACAEKAGLNVRMPYSAHVPTDSMSALTLPRPNVVPDEKMAAVGESLFRDVRLSAKGQRSCASCHMERLAFTDGLSVPRSLDAKQPLVRNTPTLLFAPLEALLMWDGRIRTADAQARAVIHTVAEMGLGDADLLSLVANDPQYHAGFQAAFGHEPSLADVGRALSAYESAVFIPEDAPIDRFARGEIAALPPLEMRGFDVFAGAGRCARCHVPPVFAGSRPPDFAAPIFAVLGVPKGPGVQELDTDQGRWKTTHLERDRNAFRTPTLRNIARTAPYFHHGKFSTLASIVDFYDKGGGLGMGLHVPSQDPEVRMLRLSSDDKRALLAFMTGALSNPLK